MPRKTARKPQKEDVCCEPGGFCFCKFVLAILIIILVWVSQATWSKVLITIFAAAIILCAHCPCKNKK